MLMMASFGVIFSLNFGFGVLGQQEFARLLLLPTWLTWMTVGGMASAIALQQASRNLRRLGIGGLRGTKCWFEIARLNWIVFLFACGTLMIPVAFALNGNAQQIPPLMGAAILMLVYVSFWLFLIAATLGYLVSFLRRRPRRGRAVECVQFFYVIIVGIGSLGAAAYRWPVQNIWPDGVITSVLALVGVVVLTGGFVANIVAYEQRKARMNGA